jgi:DnaK suppressor protein
MDMEALRKRLEDERANLLEQQEVLAGNHAAEPPMENGVSQHSADYATDLYLRDRDQALVRNAKDLIFQIDAALDRLDDGTYGICERCDQPIATERLEARPHVAYCIRCQSLMEGATSGVAQGG